MSPNLSTLHNYAQSLYLPNSPYKKIYSPVKEKMQQFLRIHNSKLGQYNLNE